MRLCPDPKALIIIHPGHNVWSLGADVDKKAMLDVDWEDMLKDEVHGQIRVGNRYYIWLSRYVGKDQYVYATESVDPNAEGSWWPF
jgi:hypothetical protein